MVNAGRAMNAATRDWAANRALGHVIAPAASRLLPGWPGYEAGTLVISLWLRIGMVFLCRV